MKKTIPLLLLFFCVTTFSQKIIETSYDSKEFKRKRSFKIYVPTNYGNDTIVKYPLAIVLDDGYLFDFYVGNAKLYAEADMAPKQIVVGIKTNYDVNKDLSIIKENGALTTNGTHFYNFIKHELIPHIQQRFKISPFISIVGAGKAANFITYYLKEPNPKINAFIGILPQFTDYTDRLISSYSLKRLDEIDNTYFLYLSNTKKVNEKQQKKFKSLQTGLESIGATKLKLKFDYLDDSPNIYSAVGESVSRAMSHIFAIYPKISKEEFNNNIKELLPLEAIKYLEQKYIDIEYLYGTGLNVRMDDIYTIEDIVIDKQDGDYLRVLGDFTMIKYPDSHLGDYYVGLYHEKGKDYEKAIFYYKEAYGKMDPSDPNTNAFYKNIERVTKLNENKPKEELTPLEDEEQDDNYDEEPQDEYQEEPQQEDNYQEEPEKTSRS